MGKVTTEHPELLRLRGLNHFTLPVRNRYRAACFYVAVLSIVTFQKNRRILIIDSMPAVTMIPEMTIPSEMSPTARK